MKTCLHEEIFSKINGKLPRAYCSEMHGECLHIIATSNLIHKLGMELEKIHINYVEFKASDLDKIKNFYHQSFGWEFVDYGPTYVAFSESGLQGGFEKAKDKIVNGALIVLYHKNLEHVKDRIVEAEGIISKDIFTFPGGRRFHFFDPAGNELAVWSDKYYNKYWRHCKLVL